MSEGRPPAQAIVRRGRRSDFAASETGVSFDIEPWDAERRETWFEAFASRGRYQLVVAEEAAEVVGFACTSQWKAKAAYDTTAEATIYLRPGVLGRGIGRALYGALFAGLAGADLRAIVAVVALPNEASLALHRSFDFVSVGVFPEVGHKFGRYHDVEWFRRPWSGPAL